MTEKISKVEREITLKYGVGIRIHKSDDVPLMSLALVNESSLKKDWVKPEEDDGWKDL